MYKQVATQKLATLWNGSVVLPVATLESSGGGVCHIIEDDHCYVVVLERDYNECPDIGGAVERRCKPTHHLFSEVVDVIKTLPTPTAG